MTPQRRLGLGAAVVCRLCGAAHPGVFGAQEFLAGGRQGGDIEQLGLTGGVDGAAGVLLCHAIGAGAFGMRNQVGEDLSLDLL